MILEQTCVRKFNDQAPDYFRIADQPGVYIGRAFILSSGWVPCWQPRLRAHVLIEQPLEVGKNKNVEEILKRVWHDLIDRATGLMNLRLMIQPAVASFLAIRAGLRDAREGRPTFLWTIVTNRVHRPELLRQGRKDVGKVFAFAALLDAIYQLIVQRGVYVLELLIVATSLAVVPYVLLRGPVAHLAKRLGWGQVVRPDDNRPESQKEPLQGERHGKA